LAEFGSEVRALPQRAHIRHEGKFSLQRRYFERPNRRRDRRAGLRMKPAMSVERHLL